MCPHSQIADRGVCPEGRLRHRALKKTTLGIRDKYPARDIVRCRLPPRGMLHAFPVPLLSSILIDLKVRTHYERQDTFTLSSPKMKQMEKKKSEPVLLVLDRDAEVERW